MQSFSIISILALVLAISATPVDVDGNELFERASCNVRQCDPNPNNNKCDITTSCIKTEPNSQFHCACRAGYKSKFGNNNTDKQYRTKFAGQEYRVFVASGVKCDTLCDQWWLGPESCKEVKVVNNCI